MSNSDRSSSAITRARHNRALAGFYTLNPGMRQSVYQGAGGQENSAKVAGLTAAPCCSPVIACSPPGAITNFVSSDFLGRPDPPYEQFTEHFNLTWDPIASGSVSITSEDLDDIIVITGATNATVYTNAGFQLITITATNTCGSSSATVNGPCFLAGSLVQMADGSAKVIEEVAVGDLVLGAFGEINEVLALHRPLLGPVATMCRINDEHSTTKHHPHISVDRQFYCGDPDFVETTTYGREHDVIDGDGVIVRRFLHGLKKGRVQALIKGINLKTVEGYRTVKTIETYAMPPETQLYNLVIGGSHTYHVDGYAVTGWPREDDFDYDTWTALSQ